MWSMLPLDRKDVGGTEHRPRKKSSPLITTALAFGISRAAHSTGDM